MTETNKTEPEQKEPKRRLSAYYLTEEEVQKLREDTEKAFASCTTPFKKIIFPAKDKIDDK